MNWLVAIIVGFLAGSLAAWIMPGGGRKWYIDIILGLLGGVVGGWVFSLLGISAGSGFWGTLLVSTIGAIILIWIGRLFTKRK